MIRNWISTLMMRLVIGAVLASSLNGVAQVPPAFENPQRTDAQSQVHAQGHKPDSSKSFVERYHAPEDITSNGHRIDWLFQYTSWVTFGFFLLMAVGLFYFVWAYRERPGHKALYTHGLSKKNKLATKTLDLAVFLSLDLVLMICSFRDTKDFMWKYPTGPDTIKIQVMPQQWVWNFRYAGNDGIFGTADDVVTINDMRVPKGKNVLLEIKSKDVIHGFFIPVLRMQVDAMPGSLTKFWFDTNKTGEWELACYHHCGTAHYKMKAFFKVMEEADYNDWIKENSEWAVAKYDDADTSTHWGWKWGI